jgi:hypothetical protein
MFYVYTVSACGGVRERDFTKSCFQSSSSIDESDQVGSSGGVSEEIGEG